jgi:TatD DNase family protein
MYSDAHTHITGSPFGEKILTPQEIQTLLKNDRDQGLVLIVAGGTDLATSRRLVGIAAAEDILYASIGIHPWIAEPLDDATYNGFKELARHPKVVAIGEIGLDASRSRSSKEIQMACLARQFRLSRETGLPPIIHQRGLRRELIEVMKQEQPPAGAMHGFNGDAGELRGWLDLGYFITIGRGVLAPEGQDLKEMVKLIPEDRLLLETDGAGRSPDGVLEGQDRVVQVAQVVASWRGTTGEEIGAISTRNLTRLLNIML